MSKAQQMQTAVQCAKVFESDWCLVNFSTNLITNITKLLSNYNHRSAPPMELKNTQNLN